MVLKVLSFQVPPILKSASCDDFVSENDTKYVGGF
jgi:hypothetical protein